MLMTNFTRFIVMLSMIELLTACATNGDNAQQPALHHGINGVRLH